MHLAVDIDSEYSLDEVKSAFNSAMNTDEDYTLYPENAKILKSKGVSLKRFAYANFQFEDLSTIATVKQYKDFFRRFVNYSNSGNFDKINSPILMKLSTYE